MTNLPKQYSWLEDEAGPKILVEALKLYGVQEVPGSKSNPIILQWAEEVGVGNTYTDDSIPWCGLAMAVIVKRAGKQVVANPLWAKNWAKYGTKQKTAMLGDILTFSRANGGGHVGIYVGEDEECFHVLGGNQKDEINISRIAKNRLFSINRTKWSVAQPNNVRQIFLDASGDMTTNEA